MLNDDVQLLIDTATTLLTRERKFSTFDMEERASGLLVTVAKLGQVSNDLQHQRIEALSLERASFGSTLAKAEGKNITERKIMADTASEYRDYKKKLETLDADLSYLKTMIDVFNNGHVMWRQFSRTEY